MNQMFLFFRSCNKKRSYDFIHYACINETEIWIFDENELRELDLEEMVTFLYDKRVSSHKS